MLFIYTAVDFFGLHERFFIYTRFTLCVNMHTPVRESVNLYSA